MKKYKHKAATKAWHYQIECCLGWTFALCQQHVSLMLAICFWADLFQKLKAEGSWGWVKHPLILQIVTLLPKESCSKATDKTMYVGLARGLHPRAVGWIPEEAALLSKEAASRALLAIWLWQIPRDPNRLFTLLHVSRMRMWIYYSSWWKQHMLSFMKI